MSTPEIKVTQPMTGQVWSNLMQSKNSREVHFTRLMYSIAQEVMGLH